MILSKAARVIRRSMFKKPEIFDGDLSYEKQKSLVSKELLHLVSLILDDNTLSDNNDVCTQTEAIKLNLAQLIQYKSVKKKRQLSNKIRHSKSNELPLPVKIGLLIHAVTRKKYLINKIAADGLCINYQRVEELQSNITEKICTKYNEGLVCPPQLTKGLFTITAIDNIDHNPSSTTATSSFHGTTISVFQKSPKDVNDKFIFKFIDDETQQHYKALPEYYTNILPIRGGKPEYPVSPNNCQLFTNESCSLNSANNWLNNVLEGTKENENKWSHYFHLSIQNEWI